MLCGIDNSPQNIFGYFPRPVWMWDFFRRIMLVSHNIFMDLNNVMWVKMLQPLVKNMVENNRSHFPIAVLLTTLICNH
jgi:hypothetical protein